MTRITIIGTNIIHAEMMRAAGQALGFEVRVVPPEEVYKQHTDDALALLVVDECAPVELSVFNRLAVTPDYIEAPWPPPYRRRYKHKLKKRKG